MIASALLAPAATSLIASVVTSLVTPAPASTPTNPRTPSQANAGRHTPVQPRMQNQRLTSLGQTLLQGAGTLFPTARYNHSEQAKGAGYMAGGAAAEGIGKRLGSSGGMLTKAFGAAMVMGGRVAQEYGQNKYDGARSTTQNTGSYNAYSPSAWGNKSA
ncbi:hypothetical protein [Pseudomonas lurida]|jgi:hypothetical protein|uniref:Glycine zipper 2TM domain-containing protein n=2 Tax=Pseudomonas TaxID=286 RepID=A0A5E6TG28_PSEFL|nr:hypothetical protein [Pseudomonas lurida]VVM14578.1 hypothetical protein PS683_02885 [Pseudomonas fluorescens]MBC3233131.1 hypothetical protein [Pseudomonas lurida]MBC3239041.1 hypothetical protein [Pseudomonas lurida]VVM92214.1 hypothetical protein PS683_02885 [Pseudomonas fluorescens]VVP73108.1 hypothetical protein PS907_02704 [Pseudomonas fluorescens]